MPSIIVPAFNEEGAIAEVIEGIRSALEKSDYSDFEVVVVDDGSVDQTGEFAKEAGSRVVRNVQNMGYGFSLKQGIKAAKHDTIVIVDSDGTYPVEMIPVLLKKYDEGYDLVVGQRTGPHYRESLIKFPLRYVLKWLVEFTVGRKVPDVNSGLRVFSKKFVMTLFSRLSNKFSFTTSQTLAYMLHMKYVHYIPITYAARIGKSKIRLFYDSLGALQMIVLAILYFNPLKLYLLLCLLAALIGVVAISVGLYWNVLASVLLGVLAFLLTIVIASLGLLAGSISQQNPEHTGK